MQPIGADALLAVVAARFDAHPWARLCVAPGIPWIAGWDLGDAVAWRSGHPWSTTHDLHVLGPPAAAADALTRLAGPGDRVIAEATTVPDPAIGLRPPHRWEVRMTYAAGAPVAGEERVGWLPDAAGVDALLDRANPDAAIRPGDRRGGRWCGVRGEDGTLLAAAVETVLSPVPHLSSLAVHPDARRQGLGRAVTSFFVREAFAAGAAEVMLATDRGNDAAAALYAALGFDCWPMAGF